MSITWIPGSRRRGGFETRPCMGRIALGAAVLAIIVYLIFPVIVVLAISFSAGNFLTFPPPGLSLRWYLAIARDPEWVSALKVSLQVGSLSAIIACLLGVPAAFALVRYVIPAKALLSALILCALVTPPIVTAISTYLFFVPRNRDRDMHRQGQRQCPAMRQ
jgi:putative spermidine/putrescine transport system permease protein